MNLKKSTPYMVRKNGEILDVTPIHPYIKYIITDDDITSIIKLINNSIRDLKWFYNNTEFNSIKQDILIFLKSIIASDIFKDKINISNIESNFNISEDIEPLFTIDDITALFNVLNNECNQEFLKLRTSSMKFGGNSGDVYFRVSSVNYNWFYTIWKLVYDNKNFITSVTICTDTQAKGGSVKFYNHNGIAINQLPVDDFINLSGNPIIESKSLVLNKIADGSSLTEAFNTIHPRHINRIINELWVNYENKNFKIPEFNLEEALLELKNIED